MEGEAKELKKDLDKKTKKYIARFYKLEQKLYKKMYKKDSVLARQVFGNLDQKYAQISRAPEKATRYASVYSGKLDSLTTSLHFLKAGGISDNGGIQKSLNSIESLQASLNQTEAVKEFIAQRRNLLKEQFSQLGLLKELKEFQKEVYYYSAQVKEFKSLLENPAGYGKKLLQYALKIPAFQKFFDENSILGSLFPVPGAGSGTAAASVQGLQTVSSLQSSITSRFGSGRQTAQLVQQNLSQAQGEISKWKEKVQSLTSGSVGDAGELPEGFKPNSQRTRSFFNRLEFGLNFQSKGTTMLLPVRTDLGLAIGYKMNDKSTFGLGLGYSLGWGRGWDHIRFSSEGVGLRSFIDMKLKGAFYATGGYEMNYQKSFATLNQLHDINLWQRSGLIGLAKRIRVTKKAKTEMRVLWDFLSYSQVPRTQAILVRFSYLIK